VEVTVKVFFDPRQVAAADSFSPSAGKPGLVVDSWTRLGIPFEVNSFAPLTTDEMALAHSPTYVKGILTRKQLNGFGNRNASVAKSLPWVCGSMAAAVRHAFETGETCFSPTSGAHHAGYNFGGGFCTFNSLMVGVQILRQEVRDVRVAIIDCDAHFGNGTADIIKRLRIPFISHYSFGEERFRTRRSSSLEWGAHAGLGSHEVSEWLEELPGKMAGYMNGCDLAIFNAGVDPHIDDPLGGYLTTEEMTQRDDIVLRTAFELGVPVALALAGGYQKGPNDSINAVLQLHDATFETAARYDRGRLADIERRSA
jgi:acetoin utilization deacetylase AcuC-like enzyme